MKNYYQYILTGSEKRFEKALNRQVHNPNVPDFGAVYDNYQYTDPKPAVYRISSAAAIYVNKDSKYYKSEKVYDFIAAGLTYIEKNQREDGTFDFVSCNFYSAPDTAFILKKMIPTVMLLKQFSFDDLHCGEIVQRFTSVIEKAVVGICEGGFHTPNHRWAIASILASALGIIKDENLRERMKKHIASYLFEGIDCNLDGEYAERSAATYNVVNNSAMLTLYEATGNEEYFEYMCRNLEMMLYYFMPDGSIFTDNSLRQDKGLKVYPRDYFYLYLYAAHKTGRPEFDAAAHKIIKDQMERNDRLAPDCLDRLMLHEELLEYEFKGCGFPVAYNKYFSGSGVVRVGTEYYSFAVMRDSAKLLVFQAGATPIYLKLGVSYNDKRSFVAQTIKQADGCYKLNYTADGWYYLPFSEKPSTSDWWAMKNENREKLIKHTLNIEMLIEPKEKGVDIKVKTTGCDRVMARFEIGVPPEALLETEDIFMPCSQGHAITVKSGTVKITNGADKISIGPGFSSHKYVEGVYGAEERSSFYQTIYFTATTNFEKSFSFCAE